MTEKEKIIFALECGIKSCTLMNEELNGKFKENITELELFLKMAKEDWALYCRTNGIKNTENENV